MTREEAIKWQETFKKNYGNFTPEAKEACDMAIKALQEQERKWISVSERLPEESNFYEVTVDFGSGPVTDTMYYNTQIGKWCTINYVTAWRERLAEPYKAGEQE